MSSLIQIPFLFLRGLSRTVLRPSYMRQLREQRAFRSIDPEEMQKYSFAEAVAYVNTMAEHCPAYGKLLNERGISLPLESSLEAWQKLPILTRADFQADPDGWVNGSLDPTTLKWSCTSGSTGQPFRFAETIDSRTSEFVSWELTLLSIGWRPEWKEAIFKAELPGVNKFQKVVRTALGMMPISFSALKLTADDTADVIAKMRQAKVNSIRGFPTALLVIADEMKRKGWRFPVKLVRAYGEGLSPARAQVIEEVFDCKVYRDYGGSEAMHIGHECNEFTGYHLDLARFYVEVLKDGKPAKPGESGEIVVTCFHNHAMPFVRYRIGDLGTLADPHEPCRCGNRTPRLARVDGRLLDILYAPNGRSLNSGYLVIVMEYYHEYFTAFKVYQTAPDSLEIHYVSAHENLDIQKREIEAKLGEPTANGFKISWKKVDEIRPEASGKRPFLVPLKGQWRNAVD